jgi:hypothetical protein
VSFTAVVEAHGRTATGIAVPEEEVLALDGGKRPAVTVTFGSGFSYRTTVAPMGGRYLIPVSAEIRQEAGLSAGDEVTVTLVLDTAPRVLDVPADLAAALAGSPAAQAFWDTLSYSNRRGYVMAVEGARAADTRARRIASTVEKLEAGKVR